MEDYELSTGMRMIARAIVGCSLIAAVVLAALFASVLLLPSMFAEVIANFPGGDSPEYVTGQSRVGVLVLLAVSIAPIFWGIWHMAAMFRGFLRGDVLTPMTARHLRFIGMASIATVVLGSVVKTLVGMIVSTAAPGPGGEFSVTVGSGGFATLLFGGMLIVLGAIMGHAAQIAEDNRQIV